MTVRFLSRAAMLAAMAGAIGFAGTAQAADLLSDPAPFTPAPVATFDWTGAYIGINFGYITGEYGTDIVGDTDADGFLIGGTLGYNVQIQQFVLGLEGDVGYLGAEGDDIPGVEVDSDIFGTIRGRAGFAYENLLFYATGGVAFLGVDIDAGAFSDDQTHIGFTVGGGAEFAFTDNISAKLEYLYVDFDDETYSLAVPVDADFDGHIIRGGINYRF
ncbi:MAG: outer membrane protein [Pseudomonadota bacterium]